MKTKSDQAKILNALRMGVIPDAKLEDLIVGRDEEKVELEGFVQAISKEEVSSIKFLNGDYGVGKTFLLEYVKQAALSKNFVVAKLSINSGFNMSKFDVFYTNVMNNLSVASLDGEKGTKFEEIFAGWVKKLKRENYMNVANRNVYQVIHQLNAYNNAFASVLMIYMRAMINKDYQLANIAASWIKGDRNISYELKKQLKVKGSVDVKNAMDIFKGFVKMLKLIGYEGLIVTMDEAEIMMQSRSDIRMKAYSNIRYIMDACGSGELESCGFVIAGTDSLFYDKEKGFPSYDALKQRLGENISGGKKSKGSVRQPVIQLKHLGEEDFYQIGEKLFVIHSKYYKYMTDVTYNTIYGLVITECKKDHGDGLVTMRYFIKKMVEMLDLLEKQPDMPIFKAKMKTNFKQSTPAQFTGTKAANRMEERVDVAMVNHLGEKKTAKKSGNGIDSGGVIPFG